MSSLTSVVIVTFNHERYMQSCLDTILNYSDPYEIIVVDNNSVDATVKIASKYPKVTVIETHANLGYGAGNNIGARHAQGKYLLFLNPDTMVSDQWLSELIRPIEERRQIITTPKILTYDGQKINTCGNINHFTGFTFTRGYGDIPTTYNTIEEVSGFSGCCFAIRKEDFIKLGGFDENFFLYNEDSDLSWRAQLRNFTILFIPSSIVMHDYHLQVSARKVYHLEKGRYLILRKYVPKKYLGAFLFSLIIAEVLTLGYSFSAGTSSLTNKTLAIIDGLTMRTKPVKGNWLHLLKSLNAEIPSDQLSFNQADVSLKTIINKIFYWNLKLLR